MNRQEQTQANERIQQNIADEFITLASAALASQGFTAITDPNGMTEGNEHSQFQVVGVKNGNPHLYGRVIVDLGVLIDDERAGAIEEKLYDIVKPAYDAATRKCDGMNRVNMICGFQYGSTDKQFELGQ